MIAGKLAHLTWALAIPLLLHPWWIVLAFYLACSWVVGLLLAIIFQLAHCVDVVDVRARRDAPRRGAALRAAPAAHHRRRRLPVPCRCLRWLMGGLDHQVEHHLAPRLPHTLYPLLARRLRAACAERGLTYRVHPTFTAAVRSHVRWLRQMGRRPDSRLRPL